MPRGADQASLSLRCLLLQPPRHRGAVLWGPCVTAPAGSGTHGSLRGKGRVWLESKADLFPRQSWLIAYRD